MFSGWWWSINIIQIPVLADLMIICNPYSFFSNVNPICFSSLPPSYSVEWVEIRCPKTGEPMFANLDTGECLWEAPLGATVWVKLLTLFNFLPSLVIYLTIVDSCLFLTLTLSPLLQLQLNYVALNYTLPNHLKIKIYATTNSYPYILKSHTNIQVIPS